MATTFASFLPNILVQVPGVPITVCDTQVRFAATEFCRLSGAWVEDLTPIDSVIGQDEYTVVSNDATNGLVRTIRSVSYDNVPVSQQEIKVLRREYPTHPDAANLGVPELYAMVDRDTITFIPLPIAVVVGGIEIRATIIPKSTATGLDAGVAEDYEEAIISGALFRLMIMPDKTWTDQKTGEYHGRKFRNEISMARARVEKGFSDVSIQVENTRSVLSRRII